MSKPFALIIEDDEDLSIIFAQALKVAGFGTEIARSGDAALTQLETKIPSIIFLDLHLPKVSGKEILRQIRSEARFAKTQVILATGDVLQAENLRKEAELVLIKPIRLRQIIDLVRRLHLDIAVAQT